MTYNRIDPFAGLYQCHGHYHRLTDHLMVNPFSKEVMPDQWCQGNKPFTPPYSTTAMPEKRVKRMSEALWCKPGKHAFDPDDESAEQSITMRVKDRYGEWRNETKSFTVCYEHFNTPFRATEAKAINGQTEKE